jgi:hypothetical protein
MAGSKDLMDCYLIRSFEGRITLTSLRALRKLLISALWSLALSTMPFRSSANLPSHRRKATELVRKSLNIISIWEKLNEELLCSDRPRY